GQTDIKNEHVSNSDTDSDEDENESNISSPILSSSIQFPSLLDDKNINIRNAYETIAISCFTKKLTKTISDPNVFHINNQQELYLQYVACAFSTHKVYIIDVAEDEL
ncbi:unnamed protein product, partial [Adineta steineri]